MGSNWTSPLKEKYLQTAYSQGQKLLFERDFSYTNKIKEEERWSDFLLRFNLNPPKSLLKWTAILYLHQCYSEEK